MDSTVTFDTACAEPRMIDWPSFDAAYGTALPSPGRSAPRSTRAGSTSRPSSRSALLYDLVHGNVHGHGGYFAPMEAPEALVHDHGGEAPEAMAHDLRATLRDLFG